jgi:hypothetical protein
MKVRDPHDLISQVNLERFNSLKGIKISTTPNDSEILAMALNYVEPNDSGNSILEASSWFEVPSVIVSPGIGLEKLEEPISSATGENVLKGKIQRLGDYIDTDAVCTSHWHPGLARIANRHSISAGTSKFPCRKQN